MRRKTTMMFASVMVFSASVWLVVALIRMPSHQIPVLLAYMANVPALTPSVTAATTTSGSGSSSGPDTTIIAAIVTSIATIVAGLLGTLYGAHLQRRHMHYQKELDVQDKTKQQEEEVKALTLEATRREMLLAQNNEQRALAYRHSLRADPRIAHLQILEMGRPLDITSVFVRVRVHEETRLRYEIDPQLSIAEEEHDPDTLLRASRTSLEHRASTALDPIEAIRRHRRCVIVGDPGAGKTTLLKFLALKAADHQLQDVPDLPIHIELNAFAANAECQDLLDYAAQTWDKRYAFPRDDARAYLNYMLRDGKALLLLDALDETVIGEQTEHAEASYRHACEEILSVATRYPRVPIVVTARKAGYQQRMPLTGFAELEVVDFRQKEMEQFITRWFADSPGQQSDANAEDLKARLRRNPRIQALGANPLLLSLIVLVYEAHLDLPDRRADLYRRCVEVLLTEWDARRNIRRRREFKPEHKRQLLMELAWHFHRQGRRYFPQRELQAEIARFLPALGLPVDEYDRVLQEITNENGLLKEQAYGWYGFLHLTLQEYFVAQYVNDHPQDVTVVLQQVGDPWWEEVILLYAGQTADASPLLQHLLGQHSQEVLQDDLFHTNLITAGHCLAAHPTVRQVSLRQEVTSRLFHLLTTSPYPLVQSQVTEALAEIGEPAVNARLLSLLADEQLNWYIRWCIARALGSLGERSVAPDLLRLLADEQLDPSVRGSIAEAFGSLGEDSVAPDLLRLLADEQLDLSVRGCIAEALANLGERSVAPDLLRLLADEQLDPSTRQSIAKTLGGLGERSVTPHLLLLLADERLKLSVRESIAEALGCLGEDAIAPDLLRLLVDEQLNSYIRGCIAKALGELGERSVAPDLLRLLVDKQLNWYIRWCTARALGSLGERSVAPDLLRLLADEQLNSSIPHSAVSTRRIVDFLVKRA